MSWGEALARLSPRSGCRVVHAVALALLALAPPARAFYLPGVAPREYEEGAPVELKVNKLISSKTQLPYGYYVLPVCKPEKIQDSVENLGEILKGDLIQNSPYDIKMRVSESCRFLCQVKLTEESKNQFKKMIDDEYTVNWIVDNLPAATRYKTGTSDSKVYTYASGFPVGLVRKGRYFAINHVLIDIHWHRNPSKYEGFRIVGLEVEPYSVNQAVQDRGEDGMSAMSCVGDTEAEPAFNIDHHEHITYTYDVVWTESQVRWASRWDSYLKMASGDIHWFSIVNSLLIVVLLTGMVALILVRTLRRDIAKYNELATAEELAEETGWKLVHGDVFRAPQLLELFAAVVGSGVQLILMATALLIFGIFGFMSPAHRGGLLQSMLILFAFFGCAAGYVSARIIRTFGSEGLKITTVLTAVIFPGMVFSIFFVLNLLVWAQKSSGAVPFVTMFAMLVLWFGISVPLVFLGSYFGFQRPPIEMPVRVAQHKRPIPLQPWYYQPLTACMVGGSMPFAAAFTEVFFVMQSLWLHQFYYLFGYIAIMGVILVITSAEISITVTYFQLTMENYAWWWGSLAASGSSGVYVFLFSAIFFITRLSITNLTGTLLYFGYMWIVSAMFTFFTGSCGMLSSFMFVRTIYGSIKVD